MIQANTNHSPFTLEFPTKELRYRSIFQLAPHEEPRWISHPVATNAGEPLSVDLHVVQAIILGEPCIVVWARVSIGRAVLTLPRPARPYLKAG